jgi:small conductance mechanosensitive channel
MNNRPNRRALIRAIVLIAAAALVFGIGRMTNLIDTLPKVKLDGTRIINGILLLLILFIVESVVSWILGMLKPSRNRSRTVIALFRNVVRYAVILIAICVVLSMFSVDIGTILAGLGIIALIVGFGAESLIADVVTGLFILIDNQYNVGDIIEVNGFRGTVTDISVRTTVLTDVGGNVKIINNSDMKNILNRSDNASIAVSTIDIPYGADLEGLEAKIPGLMSEIYHAHEDVMMSEPKYLGVAELGSSGVTLKFIVEVEEDKIFSAPRVLNHDLLLGFKKLGVEVPFPQLDIHTK